MKLIIFLLLTVSAWGQWEELTPIHEPEPIGVWGDSVTEVLSLQRFIWYWDTYKAECWADSTLEKKEAWYSTKDNRLLREEETWTHRSPDPFEFIDKYLRKKSKGDGL